MEGFYVTCTLYIVLFRYILTLHQIRAKFGKFIYCYLCYTIFYEGGRALRPWATQNWLPNPLICKIDLRTLRRGSKPRASGSEWQSRRGLEIILFGVIPSSFFLRLHSILLLCRMHWTGRGPSWTMKATICGPWSSSWSSTERQISRLVLLLHSLS